MPGKVSSDLPIKASRRTLPPVAGRDTAPCGREAVVGQFEQDR